MKLLTISILTCLTSVYAIAGTFTDGRDKKIYKTVEIGDRTWMAQNLNYKMKGSFCYEDDEMACKKYGRLYTFGDAQKACPEGWHLANTSDWESLEVAARGRSLKLAEDWEGGSGKNDTRFSGVPAGFRNSKGKYELFGKRADFWSADEEDNKNGKYWFLSFRNEKLDHNKYSKKGAMSVRCVEDMAEESEEEYGCDMSVTEHYSEQITNNRFVTCEMAINDDCFWRISAIRTYVNVGVSCRKLFESDGEALEPHQLIDMSKVSNTKLIRILRSSEANVYLREESICAYNWDYWSEGSDDEICIPLNQARSFLTPYARKLFE